MNICSFLDPVAKLNPDRPALSVGDLRYATYAELAARVARLASGLVHSVTQVEPGDRIGIAMKNCPEYVEIQLACWWAGLCVVPINAKLHAREFAYILDNSGAKACFVDAELANVIDGIKADVPSLNHVFEISGGDYEALLGHDAAGVFDAHYESPAWIFYTSGTSGTPKGATLSHRNLWGMAWRYYVDIDPVSYTDTYIHAAPISHGSGLYGLPHLMKASHIVIPPSGAFDVDEIFDLMTRYRNITFFAAPTMVNRMTNHPAAASARATSLKTIYYGGAPMYLNDIRKALSTFGCCFYQCFGQGESPMTGIGMSKATHADESHPRYLERLASTGTARTGVDVRIVDPEDRDLPIGEPGEILFRSDVTMLGYWNNPEASAAALRGGWLHTGDIGVFDEDGFVTLKDRSKDMIISGGSNIYPREIEEILITDPRVAEASVVGRPHADWGEEVVAFVVVAEGRTITAADLDELCLDNIARFKRPKDYVFVENLPKSNYGKILKTKLRERLARADSPA